MSFKTLSEFCCQTIDATAIEEPRVPKLIFPKKYVQPFTEEEHNIKDIKSKTKPKFKPPKKSTPKNKQAETLDNTTDKNKTNLKSRKRNIKDASFKQALKDVTNKQSSTSTECEKKRKKSKIDFKLVEEAKKGSKKEAKKKKNNTETICTSPGPSDDEDEIDLFNFEYEENASFDDDDFNQLSEISMNDEENEYDGGSSGESENESESENDCEGGETVNVNGKKSTKAKGYNWSEGLTLQLIDTYVKYKERFSEGNPATKVWERFIVRDLHLTIPRGVKLPSKQQCITRWNSMLRTYNKAIHQNNVSGNRRRKLPYYHENLHEAVKKEPKITPKYLASTNSITTQNPNLSSSSSSSASINTSRSNEGDEKRKYRSSTDIMMARMEKWKQEMEAREMAREQAIEARFQRLEALAERKISVLERIEKKL